MVLWIGAHTLGVARCSSFKNRLSSNANDPTLNTEFAKTLSKTCSAGDKAEQPLDATKNNFDNLYFNALQRKSGVLFSDQTLFASPITRTIVNDYAFNQAMFFFHFQQSMVKMSTLDVKEGSKGEVRDNCRRINWYSSLYLRLEWVWVVSTTTHHRQYVWINHMHIVTHLKCIINLWYIDII